MDDQFWDRLERDGLLTRNEVAQARARYEAAGGAPDTAICEVRPLSSDDRQRLRRLLARAVDQPIAPPAFFEAPETEALSFLPRELADRHALLAVRLTPELLTLVAPAMPARVLAEISFVVGRKVQPYVALESDIRHALARHLGLAPPLRFQALGAPSPTPPAPVRLETAEPASGSSLGQVDKGWGTQGAGLSPLRALRPPGGTAELVARTDSGQRDWVARALEVLRAAPDGETASALGRIAAPGMSALVYLRRFGDDLRGWAASQSGQPLDDIQGLELPADPDTVIGKAALRGHTRCGPYRADPAFQVLYEHLGLPLPGDVLVAPVKRGANVVGVFVGDHGAQAIAPVTASAVRRLLTGLAELWPEVPVPATAARGQTDELVSLPPSPAPPPFWSSAPAPQAPEPVATISRPPAAAEPEPEPEPEPESDDSQPPLPEWVPPPGAPPIESIGNTLTGMPSRDRITEEVAALDLSSFEPMESVPPAPPPPPPEPIAETRPGLPVLGTRPMMPAVTQSMIPAVPATQDTTFDMRPMALAELADALALEEASRPTETLSTAAISPPAEAQGPTPQLLDLDNMATVPALSRIRPLGDPAPPPSSAPAPAPPPAAIPTPPPPVSAEGGPRSLPFPTPGWTDELPLPAVTAVRSIRIEAETDVELPALPGRAAPASAAPPPSPEPAPERAGFHFDPPSGPMPRVTVILTPAPTPAPPVDAFEPAPTPRAVSGATPLPTSAAPPPVGPPRRLATDDDVRAALADLSSSDADVRHQAEGLLLSIGEPALDAIFAAFPGHLVVDRFAHPAGGVPVENHSGLLHLIVRLGPLAAGRLEQLCGHLSPEIRYYAVYAFSTLRSQRSLPAVLERLHDPDASVRDVAAWTLEQYRGQPAFRSAVEQLRAELKQGPARRRRPMVDAAGRLRLAEAIPELVALLGDLAAGLQEPAHRALQEICRADLGLEAWKWQKWIERNRHRPRVEWLLDGLLSDHRHIRAGALQELRRLTHQNYGYLVDAPPAERRAAHERWLRWWRDTGMTRFAGYK